MSMTIMANPMNQGVRRLTTLGGWGLGADLAAMDIMQSMIIDGYNSSTLNELITAGATAPMLQNLWDNTAAGSQEFADAANQLLTNLTGGPGGAASAPGYPAAAIPTTISTAFGVYDLTQQWAWDAINSQFTSTQQQLAIVARQAPKDPEVIQMVQDFNGLVAQWAGYYHQVFGSDPSPMPSVSLSGLGVVQLGVIAAAVVAGIALLLGTLYLLNQRILAKAQQVQAQAGLQAAQTQGTLSQQLAVAQAKGDTVTAQRILTTMQATGGQAPAATTNWSAWLQQNMGLLIVGLAAIVIVPPLLRKR